MFKILHTADLHLQQVGDDRWQALQEILVQAQKLKVEVITISGDLFDHDVQAQLIRQKIRPLFDQAPCPIVMIAGNHDQQSLAAGYSFGQQAHQITQLNQPITIKGVNFYGLPFQNLTQSELMIQLQHQSDQLDLSQPNLLLFHGELLDRFFSPTDFGEEGGRRYLPIDLKLASQLKFTSILAGHFHRQPIIEPLAGDQPRYFIYPGSPVSITQKELGPRQAVLITIGQPPRLIPLATTFFQELSFAFDHRTSPKIWSTITKKITDQPATAKLLLEFGGYFDHQQLALTEQQLVQKITELRQQWPNITQVINSTQDISQIYQHPVFKKFQAEINNQSTTNDQNPSLANKNNQSAELLATLTAAMIKVIP